MTWLPPQLAKRGMTEVSLDLLIDLAKLPSDRRLPSPGASVVYDRAYDELRKAALIHKMGEGFSSYYVLSSDGIGRFNEYERLKGSLVHSVGGTPHKDATEFLPFDS